MSSNAQLAVQNRYARCPIASPSVKYSNRASSVTNPTASAKIAVDPHSTIPTTNGINTTAVATRFQVIEMESPQRSRPSSHHIMRNKSRRKQALGMRVKRAVACISEGDLQLVAQRNYVVLSTLQNFLVGVECHLLRLAVQYEVDRPRGIPGNGHLAQPHQDRKSTRLNSSHTVISYAVFCLKKKMKYMVREPTYLRSTVSPSLKTHADI